MDEKNLTTRQAASSADVIDFYDSYASSWDARFPDVRSSTEFHHARLQSFISIAQLTPEIVAMELGVGTGVYLDQIACLVKKVICVDGSEKMLEVLRQKHGHLKNIETICLDLAKSLPARIPQADILYAFGLLEHIIDFSAFMRNCRALVRPGGSIVFVTPNGRSPWYGVMRRLWRAGKHCSTDRYYTKEQIDELMHKYGFRCVAARYWGFSAAGIGRLLDRLLRFAGRLVEKTPLRYWAGGLTVRYVCVDEWAEEGSRGAQRHTQGAA